MLSNHENQERMRCKLVENLKFDSHFEASRLRDYSGYSGGGGGGYSGNHSATSASSSTLTEPPAGTVSTTAAVTTTTPNSKSSDVAMANLAQKLTINKEAINEQIKEDVVGEEEFATVPTSPPPFGQQSTAVVSSGNQQQQQQQQRPPQASSGGGGDQVLLAKDQKTQPSGGSGNSQLMSRTSSVSTMSGVSFFKQPTTGTSVGSPYDGSLFAQLEEKEKLLIKSDCELITVTRVIKGNFNFVFFIKITIDYYFLK